MSKAKEDRVKRIRKERNRLRRIFNDVEGDKKKIVIGLIERASFLRVSLEDYENDINENGSVDMFSQGDQRPYERARPVVQQYNSANKLYQTITKQISEMLPENDKVDSKIFIMDDLRKPK